MAVIWRPPHQSSMGEITVRWSDGRSGRISTAVSLERLAVVPPPRRRRPARLRSSGAQSVARLVADDGGPGNLVEVAAEVLQPFIGDCFGDVAGADAAD